ncbi:MAG: C40 family peptidase [Erysipelotrichaceae bacterium]|nr:C40 family peptidase [Erysipelotrichaceae bacterium]
MLKKLIVCNMALLLLIGLALLDLNYLLNEKLEAQSNVTEPTFRNISDYYLIEAGTDLDFSDAYYIDGRNIVHRVYFAENINTYVPGTYKLTAIVKNSEEYVSKGVTVKIEEPDCSSRLSGGYYDPDKGTCVVSGGATLFYNTGSYSTYTDATDVYGIAESLLGVTGSCQDVMCMFYNKYFGRQLLTIRANYISYEEALPGDMIFYMNGGNGYTHVAVYLGDGMALQGNYSGRAVIRSIYLPRATEPMFARVIPEFAD